jgi:hypothetical protein
MKQQRTIQRLKDHAMTERATIRQSTVLFLWCFLSAASLTSAFVNPSQRCSQPPPYQNRHAQDLRRAVATFLSTAALPTYSPPADGALSSLEEAEPTQKKPSSVPRRRTFVLKKKQPTPSTTELQRPMTPPDLDSMRARAAVLRRSILAQQLELQKLEREIICCSSSSNYNIDGIGNDDNILALSWNKTITTLKASTDVLLRKLGRVQAKAGTKNQRWNSVSDFVSAQTWTGVRIVDRMLKNSTQLFHLVVDPHTPTLVPHVPAILARLDRLEHHVPPILERVLNNQRHLASIEPYLPQILDRFDDIEPHLPWVLDNIDILAPYTGLLLKHIDELLPYAHLDDHEDLPVSGGGKGVVESSSKTQYSLAEQLLPYLEFYVSRLDTVGPHLPLLRPHVPKLLKHNRIAKMSPHIDRLFALGYKDNLGASANMDVLLFWFGWALRVPGLPRLFFAIPGSPRIVTFLANRLPKRFVRGYCSSVSCTVDNDFGPNWNKLQKS